MKELFNITDIVVLLSITLSITIPLQFMMFGWLKRSDIRGYIKELRFPYFMFALYGLVRLCM